MSAGNGKERIDASNLVSLSSVPGGYRGNSSIATFSTGVSGGATPSLDVMSGDVDGGKRLGVGTLPGNEEEAINTGDALGTVTGKTGKRSKARSVGSSLRAVPSGPPLPIPRKP